MLNNLIGKLRAKARPDTTSPLDSLAATHLWAEQLRSLHEYEAHRQVVLLLDQFNQLTTSFNDQRLHILALIEHVGSKLQQGLIAQFLKNQANLKYAGESLWRDIVAFYWQLAQAYQRVSSVGMLQQKYASLWPTMILRALHYQGKLIQWRYVRYELPTPQIWNALHSLYSVAVAQGFSGRSIVLKGSAYCSCDQIYARILLLHLMRPVGLTPDDIELAAYWAWKWRATIRFDTIFGGGEHSHFVALQESAPPQALDAHLPRPGSALYWSVGDTLAEIKTLLANTEQSQAQAQAQVKLYDVPYTADKKSLLTHIRAKLSDRTSPANQHTAQMPEQVHISCGEKNVIAALAHPESSERLIAYPQLIGHPDEDYFRLNVPRDAARCEAGINDLVMVHDEAGIGTPTLSVIRWAEKSDRANATLSMEKIGVTPRLVDFLAVAEASAPTPFADAAPNTALVAISLSQPSTLISFHAVERRYLDVLEGDYIYRIRIQALLEKNAHWLRFRFTRLSRTYRPQSAAPQVAPDERARIH